MPKKIRELSEKYSIPVPKSSFLQPEKQQNVRTLLRDYFASLSKHLIKDHLEMQEFEKQNKRILQTKGEISQERKEKLEAMQISFDKFLSATQNFAEVLDENMPVLVSSTTGKDDDVSSEPQANPDQFFDNNLIAITNIKHRALDRAV